MAKRKLTKEEQMRKKIINMEILLRVLREILSSLSEDIIETLDRLEEEELD